MPTYTFTEEQARSAHEAWGCNCGPTALAFALQTTLEAVRYALPDFPARRYTSPTMMAGALQELGRTLKAVRNPSQGGKLQASIDAMFAGPMSLTRIQWTGPWTAPGANSKWASRQTHWVATWAERGVPILFDCNGGIQGLGAWETNIVPLIVATIPRADGRRRRQNIRGPRRLLHLRVSVDQDLGARVVIEREVNHEVQKEGTNDINQNPSR